MTSETAEDLVPFAVGDDARWARLEARFGPVRLQLACHHMIGCLIDEHRAALRQLPGPVLAGWLVRHREQRAWVESRLAALDVLASAARSGVATSVAAPPAAR